MAYFPRQKRQARFYWAELGFLVMGLFALQPNLLTSLFSNVMPKPVLSNDRLNYLNSQGYNGLIGRDWKGGQLIQSYMAAPPTLPGQSLANWNSQIGYGSSLVPPGQSYAPSMPSSYLPSYAAYNNSGLVGQTLQNGSLGSNYASFAHPPSDLMTNQQPNYYAQSYQPTPYQPTPYQPTPYQPAPYQPAPYQTYPASTANAWNTQPSYVAQSNSPWPNSANYSNSSSSNRGIPTAASWSSTNSSNPFSSFLTKSQQPNMLRSGEGGGNYSPTALRYSYPSTSPAFDSWTPYQPSGSSIYR